MQAGPAFSSVHLRSPTLHYPAAPLQPEQQLILCRTCNARFMVLGLQCLDYSHIQYTERGGQIHTAAM